MELDLKYPFYSKTGAAAVPDFSDPSWSDDGRSQWQW